MITPTAGTPVAGTPPATGSQVGNQAVIQLRKALGVPEDQPAPEMKVIEACQGKLGPQVQRMAEAVAGGAYGRPMSDKPAPTTPDRSQPGGESAPPDPTAPDTADASNVQPGAQTGGRMGSATIFGRRPVSATGEQDATQAGGPEDEDDDRLTARSMFGRRR